MNFTRLSVLSLVAVLLVGAAAGGVAAQENASDGDLYATLESMVPTYNENTDSIDLGPINLAGTSNIYIRDGGETVTYSVTMDRDNRITSLDDERDPDAVRKITTDRATIESIANADNPAAAFRSAVASDDIRISGEDGKIIEGIKWTVVNALKGFFL